MRIIDKNTDFYDYLQNVYRDNSITFDRTDSFVLTKDIVCKKLDIYTYPSWDKTREHNRYNFMLLQICNTFWLFLIEFTKVNKENGRKLNVVDYEVELLSTWKNYNKPRKLIQLEVISIIRKTWRYDFGYNKEDIVSGLDFIKNEIDMCEYKVEGRINMHEVVYGDGKIVEKHIPLLKASGLASELDALDVYLSFEEYFSLEKTSSERIYSKDITDKDKIENHGFDINTSFRGKQ